MADQRPISELRDSGLLWLVNASVFHPRGLAMALHVDSQGEVTGWSLLGDGNEPWRFDDADADERFLAATATLDEAMEGARG